MKFKVLKSSMDGISGGASDYATIDDVLREISFYKGWPSLKALHNAIRKWSHNARPGGVFCTQVTAVVAVAVDRLDSPDDDLCPHCGHDGLDYDDVEPVEGGDFEQRVSCPRCGERWIDVYSLTDRRSLAPRERRTDTKG